VLRSLSVLLLLGAMLLPAHSAVAAGAEDARQFVDNVGKRVVEIINTSGNETQKQQKLRQLFTENVDIEWMGKFVLGSAWQQATEDQRQQYLKAYRDYLLARYTTNFADYTGSNYTITDAQSGDNGQFTVGMEIKSPNAKQPNTEAGYRVRLENGQFKIIDIIVEGVSLITTERSEFAAVFQQKGMDGLISSIEAKTKTEAKS
jgi:phospholipid transport system substrate-binding protein